MKTLRMTAWTFVALALALVGADLISTLEAGKPVVRTTREVINLIPGVALEPLGTSGAAGIANLMLDFPLWGVLGLFGVLVTFIVRPSD
ncbi:MAG: hypothetical protein AAGI89_07435 [Pseudomonadota bacterium]